MHRWMASVGKLGGQHKCPRCANHRDIMDPLRAIAGLAEQSAAEGETRSGPSTPAGSASESNG
jgi:hypothetical protein